MRVWPWIGLSLFRTVSPESRSFLLVCRIWPLRSSFQLELQGEGCVCVYTDIVKLPCMHFPSFVLMHSQHFLFQIFSCLWACIHVSCHVIFLLLGLSTTHGRRQIVLCMRWWLFAPQQEALSTSLPEQVQKHVMVVLRGQVQSTATADKTEQAFRAEFLIFLDS